MKQIEFHFVSQRTKYKSIRKLILKNMWCVVQFSKQHVFVEPSPWILWRSSSNSREQQHDCNNETLVFWFSHILGWDFCLMAQVSVITIMTLFRVLRNRIPGRHLPTLESNQCLHCHHALYLTLLMIYSASFGRYVIVHGTCVCVCVFFSIVSFRKEKP